MVPRRLEPCTRDRRDVGRAPQRRRPRNGVTLSDSLLSSTRYGDEISESFLDDPWRDQHDRNGARHRRHGVRGPLVHRPTAGAGVRRADHRPQPRRRSRRCAPPSARSSIPPGAWSSPSPISPPMAGGPMPRPGAATCSIRRRRSGTGDASDPDSLVAPARDGALRVLARGVRGRRRAGGHDVGGQRGQPDLVPGAAASPTRRSGPTPPPRASTPTARSKTLAERAAGPSSRGGADDDVVDDHPAGCGVRAGPRRRQPRLGPGHRTDAARRCGQAPADRSGGRGRPRRRRHPPEGDARAGRPPGALPGDRRADVDGRHRRRAARRARTRRPPRRSRRGPSRTSPCACWRGGGRSSAGSCPGSAGATGTRRPRPSGCSAGRHGPAPRPSSPARGASSPTKLCE